MAALVNLFWLVLFVAVGFPVALGIELYLRNVRRATGRAPRTSALHNDEFMPVPQNSAIARRSREPAHASEQPVE